MNLKKAKKIRKALFHMGIVHRETIILADGQAYNHYRRQKKRLARGLDAVK